jgi:hypothetical protein
MDGLLKFLIIWFSIDVVVIATGYYAANVIKPYFPDWWSAVICGDGSEIEPEFGTVALPVPLPPKF